jgi:hypothetical protein
LVDTDVWADQVIRAAPLFGTVPDAESTGAVGTVAGITEMLGNDGPLPWEFVANAVNA